MKNILVLCEDNSCRSQIAQGYLTHYLKQKAQVYSAGFLTTKLDEKAVAIADLDALNISNHTVNSIHDYLNTDFDYIITMSTKVLEEIQQLTYYSKSKAIKIHQDFFDPSLINGSNENIFNFYEKSRKQIKVFCQGFIANYF